MLTVCSFVRHRVAPPFTMWTVCAINASVCMQKRWMMCISVCVGTRITHAYVYICVCICASSWCPSSFVASVHAEPSIYGWDARDRNMYTREREREERKKCRYMNGMCSTFDTGNLREELYVRNAYFTNRDSSSSHTHAHSSHTPKNDALIENTTTTMKKKSYVYRKKINQLKSIV